MKKYFLLAFFVIIFSVQVNAQVGIGTMSPQAQLDVVTDATATSERRGIQVDLNSTSTAQQNTYSLHLTNSSSPALTASKYGIFNNVSGAGTATRYGIYSEVFQPSVNPTGTDLYGVYSLLGLSTGITKNAYGFYTDISNVNNTSNVYGVYSLVDGSTASGQDVFSGYFLGGRFALGQSSSDRYLLPPSRGTANQIMQTDGTGNVSWVDKDANSFSLVRANLSANQIANTSGWQKIRFNTTTIDTNSEFDTTNNRFVAGTAGYYRINAGFHTAYQSNTQYYGIAVYVNNSLYQEASYNHHNVGDVVRSINCLVSLNASDYIEVFIQNYQANDGSNGANGVELDSFTGKTFFEIQRVR